MARSRLLPLHLHTSRGDLGLRKRGFDPHLAIDESTGSWRWPSRLPQPDLRLRCSGGFVVSGQW